MKSDQAGHSGGAPASEDMILELNFVPEWARGPAAKNPYGDHVPRERRDDRGRGRRSDQRRDRDRSPGDRRQRGGARPGRPSPRDRERPPQDRERPPRDRERPPRDQERPRRQEEELPARLPVDISFLPDRDKLGVMVREMHHGAKAYPLMDLASLFIRRPDHYLVKIQVHDRPQGATQLLLHQFRPSGMICGDRDKLVQYLVAQCLPEYFDVEEHEGEAPAGHFVCVGRCSLTGEILGPPNYHGYQARLQEMVATRFPRMTVDEYRQRVETVRDPELVEAWKTQNRVQKVYRLKASPSAEKAPAAEPADPEGGSEEENRPALSREEAQRILEQEILPELIHTTRKAIIPATVARDIPDEPLKRMIREAWQRESRFPLSLNLAMRPAFRNMRLYMFKVDRRNVFVTPIQPKPLDPGIAVD